MATAAIEQAIGACLVGGMGLEVAVQNPDAVPAWQPNRLARARGAVLVRAVRRGDRAVVGDLRQEGSGKALFPRSVGPALEAVLLNTAGGVAGGDDFAVTGEAGPAAWLGVASQAAERAYRARPGEIGRIAVRLRAEAGARIDWLPQETILFDRAALSRRLEVDLAADAELLAVEPVVFGRAAMGERLSGVRFSDQWRVLREGRLVYADTVRIDGPAEVLARAATFGEAGAFASTLLMAPRAEALLAPVRRLLDGDGGASLIRPGVLAVRMLAADGFELRRRLIPVLETLRGARLPAVWRM